MSRYKITFLLLCGMLTLVSSGAAAKNDLVLYGVPSPEAMSQLKSANGGYFNLV